MSASRDALICAVVDFADSGWQRQHINRVGQTMLLGQGAGDVFAGQVPGACLARRPYLEYRERGKPVRMRNGAAAVFSHGNHVLLAGRLRDRKDLAAGFSLPDASSDTELYAKALAVMGEACDERIDGDYCAIVWNPETRRLRLSSSALSMHPMHIWREGLRLVASSNPRMIFATGLTPLVDDAKIADSVLVNYSDPTRGWYCGITRLAPGTVEIHSPGGSSQKRFWSVLRLPKSDLERDDEIVEAVATELEASVAFSLEGAQVPSIQLSGGLDSSSIAAAALRLLPDDKRLKSYTWVPHDDHVQVGRQWKFDDESEHVRALAEMYPRLEPSFVQQHEDEYGEWLDRIFLLSAWPNQAYLSWPNLLFERAYADGSDVSLNGYFGNISYSYDGEAAPATWLRQGKWWRLQHELRKFEWPTGFLHKLWRYAIRPNLPRSAQLALAKRRGYHIDPFDTWVPLREDGAVAREALERAREQDFDTNYLPASRKEADIEGYVRFHEGDTGEVNQGILLTHGIEVRQPFGNRRFIGLCAGLPDDVFLRDGERRWLPRQIGRDLLPEKIRTEWRTGNDSADWPMHFRRYRNGMLDELGRLESSGRFEDIFDFPRLRRYLEDWDGTNAPGDYSEERIAAGLGRAIKLSRFVNHVEGRNVR